MRMIDSFKPVIGISRPIIIKKNNKSIADPSKTSPLFFAYLNRCF